MTVRRCCGLLFDPLNTRSSEAPAALLGGLTARFKVDVSPVGGGDA